MSLVLYKQEAAATAPGTDGAEQAPIASCRHIPNDAGVPAVSKRFFSRQSSLLKELDAPSSVAEFDHVQAKLESDTRGTANKMEGGCLREFTRFLEKGVRAA